MCVSHLPACMCVHRIGAWCLQRPDEGVGFSRAGVAGSWESHYGGLENWTTVLSKSALSHLSSPSLPLLEEQGCPRGGGWPGLLELKGQEQNRAFFTFSLMVGGHHCSQMFLIICGAWAHDMLSWKAIQRSLKFSLWNLHRWTVPWYLNLIILASSMKRGLKECRFGILSLVHPNSSMKLSS